MTIDTPTPVAAASGPAPEAATGTDQHLLGWMEELLGPDSLGVHTLTGSVRDDPSRISRAYREILSGYQVDLARVLKPVHRLDPGQRHGVVTIRAIPFVSMCAHHFLPYFGHADVAYEPADRLLGIGKLPRLVGALAGRLQLQELMGEEIVGILMEQANARGAWASITAVHTCMTHRGPLAHDASTETVIGAGTLEGWGGPGTGTGSPAAANGR